MFHQENVGKLQASLAPKRTPSNLFLNHDEHILQVIISDAANPMGGETVKNVLVLTNQRLIKFKEGSGSENGDYPKRYCVQQMHLSTIFHTKATYSQSLPGGLFEGLLAICGFLSMRKYHQMTFSKSYPDVEFSTIADKNKPFVDDVCGGIKKFIKYIFENAVIDIDEFMVQLELIRPNSDLITFEDLAEKICCCESQVHPDVQTPAVAILDRIDRFMSAFNNAHCVFRKAVNIPQRAGAKYKVFEGDQPSAYTTMKFQTKEGGKGGDRTIGINPYMLGFSGGETVVDVADVSQKVGCKAWCMCVCSLGCLYIPLIKQVLDSKAVLITTSRRIVRYEIMSPASDRVLDPTSKYARVVESFFEPYPTKSAKFERTQIEACFGCCVGKSDSEFLFETRGGQLSFSAINKKSKQANQFQSYFNHIVAYTPVVARVDPAYVASSLAIHNLPPLNPSMEMNNPVIKERFAPLVVEGEVPLAGMQYVSELAERTKGTCCLPTTEYDGSMLVTNRRIMLYNIDKQKAPCCSTLFCCCCKQGKTLATHTITIADAQYIEGAQLFYLGQTFRLCCCGMWCKKPVYDPHYHLSRAEIIIDGIDFRQEFFYMAMDTPITNRVFQVISAVSQAARVDKVAAENLLQDGAIRDFGEEDRSKRIHQTRSANYLPLIILILLIGITAAIVVGVIATVNLRRNYDWYNSSTPSSKRSFAAVSRTLYTDAACNISTAGTTDPNPFVLSLNACSKHVTGSQVFYLKPIECGGGKYNVTIYSDSGCAAKVMDSNGDTDKCTPLGAGFGMVTCSFVSNPSNGSTVTS